MTVTDNRVAGSRKKESGAETCTIAITLNEVVYHSHISYGLIGFIKLIMHTKTVLYNLIRDVTHIAE